MVFLMSLFRSPTGLLILGICIVTGAVVWWFSAGHPTQTIVSGVTVPELTAGAQAGQSLFAARCSECHGLSGQGTASGPPLIHKIYEPGHHSDEAFQRAVKLGTRAHHWSFGNMPKVDGVSRADVERILDFVRAVQRHNGIN